VWNGRIIDRSGVGALEQAESGSLPACDRRLVVKFPPLTGHLTPVLVSPTTLHSVVVGQLAPDNGPTDSGRTSVFHEPKPEVVFESIAPVELVVPPVATQFEPEHDTPVKGSRVPRFGIPPRAVSSQPRDR
jgi:hypothetical protein